MLEGKKILPTKVLVKKVERKAQETASGIIIPNSVEEVSSTGVIVLTGEGTTAVPMCVSVGNTIMYPPRAPQKVRIDDEDYYLLNVQDILLIW